MLRADNYFRFWPSSMVHHQIGLDIVVDQVIFPRILSTISESKEVPDVL